MKLSSTPKSLLRESQARTRATEQQWYLMDTAIKAFISKYHTQWFEFVKQNKQIAESQKFQKWSKSGNKAWHKDAHWTQTLSFPTILDAEGDEIDSLYPVIEKIIPALTHRKSINYDAFLKRYPEFKTMDYTK